MKTYLTKEKDIQRAWYVVDAAGRPAGRLAVQVANLLRGRTKRTVAPNVDEGDFVVVINAEQVKLTGRKEDQKVYQRFSGHPGGLKIETAKVVRQKNPARIVSHAVWGMLPKNHSCRKAFKRLKVYAGSEHPHAAQNPRVLKV